MPLETQTHSDENNEAERLAEAERLTKISQDEVIGDSAIAAANLKKQYITDSTTAETKKAIEDIAKKIENKEMTIEEWQQEAEKTQKWWLRRTTDLLHITNETGEITTGAKVLGGGVLAVGWFFAIRGILRWIFGRNKEESNEDKAKAAAEEAAKAEEAKLAAEAEAKAKALAEEKLKAEAEAAKANPVPPTTPPVPGTPQAVPPSPTNTPPASEWWSNPLIDVVETAENIAAKAKDAWSWRNKVGAFFGFNK